MSDKKRDPPKVEVHDSGAITVKLPADLKQESNIEVTPGSQTHEVLVESHNPKERDESTPPGDPPVDRRRQQTPVNVQVQPSIPGLPGWHGIVAQWGAFGFVILLSYLMWTSIDTRSKEDRAYSRERDVTMMNEIRAVNAAADRRDTAFVTAMTAITNKFDAATSKFDATNINILAAIVELKAAKLSMEAKLDKILDALKAKFN